MTSIREQRRIRLKNDYQTMVNIKRPWLNYKIISGTIPYIEQYVIDLKLKIIVGRGPKFTNSHRISIILPATYPHNSAPQIRYLDSPKPFHPNWFTSGNWCYGTWLIHESLGEHVIRMIQTLQYDLQITHEGSPANSDANSWFKDNLSNGIFPSDKTELPDPTVGRMKLSSELIKKKFIIKG